MKKQETFEAFETRADLALEPIHASSGPNSDRHSDLRSPSPLSPRLEGQLYARVQGAVIRRFREVRGPLSQYALGQRTNLVTTVISRIELGKVIPTLAQARALATGLGLSIHALIRRIEEAMDQARDRLSALRAESLARGPRLTSSDPVAREETETDLLERLLPQAVADAVDAAFGVTTAADPRGERPHPVPPPPKSEP